MNKSKLLTALLLAAPLTVAYAQSADVTTPRAADTAPIYTPPSAATNATINESAPPAPVVDSTATNATTTTTTEQPGVKQKIKNGAHTVKRDAKSAKSEIKSDSKEAWNGAKDGAHTAKQDIKTGTKRAWNGVKEGAHEAKDKVKSAFKGDNQSAPAPVTERSASVNSDTTLSNAR